jgi:protein required for attachment to host cells
MPLPHDALVLVADGRKMLLFRNHGDLNQMDLRTETHGERENIENMEANSDGPGTSFQSFSPRRSSYEVTDVHQMEEDRWIKDAAEELKRRALRNDFAALVIVAPPRSLGVLKKYLHKEVERRVVVTVNKEMSARPIPDIETLLGNAMQTELPDV